MRDLTNTPYKQFIWFIAEVVETITDTDQLGRVRIRVLGFHSEDTPNNKLPLALVMNGGAARLVEKQWVVGFFLDGEFAQQPFVLGTVGSAIGNPAKVSSQENPGPNQNTTKGSIQSIITAIDIAKEKLKRAANPGEYALAQAELNKLLEELKKAEAEAAAAASNVPATTNPPVGTATGLYPDVFPANGKYPFEYLGIPQSPNSPYGREATAAAQPFSHIVFHDTAGGGSGPSAVQGGQQIDPAKGYAAGYHFYIDRNGNVFQGAPLNVRTNGVLSSVAGYDNKNTINIAFINSGADMGNDPTPAQLKTGALLVQDVGNNFGIPKSNIVSHGTVSPHKSQTEAITAYNYAMKTYVDPPKATIPTSAPPPPIKIGTGP